MGDASEFILYYSDASPYARKCRIVVDLCELSERVKLVHVLPSETPEHRDVNPLGKIPALIHGARTVIDSPLICEYIHWFASQRSPSTPALYPSDHDSYFDVQTMHCTANGILDAAVNIVVENRRETEHSSYWISRWRDSIEAVIKRADLNALGTVASPNIASIAMGSALGYLDFRHTQMPWRNWNSSLAEWFRAVEKSQWMQASAPR